MLGLGITLTNFNQAAVHDLLLYRDKCVIKKKIIINQKWEKIILSLIVIKKDIK